MVERSSRSWGTCISKERPKMDRHISIREFHYPEDYEAVFKIWETAGNGIHIARSDMPGEIEKKLARDPDLFLVAEEEADIVGTVIGGFDGRRGMMYHLAVAPQARNQGIASALVSELETRLARKGCMRMYLLVYPDNQTAIDFYQKRNYQKMSVDVYGKDLL